MPIMIIIKTTGNLANICRQIFVFVSRGCGCDLKLCDCV